MEYLFPLWVKVGVLAFILFVAVPVIQFLSLKDVVSVALSKLRLSKFGFAPTDCVVTEAKASVDIIFRGVTMLVPRIDVAAKTLIIFLIFK
ncbi:hypothetical protein X559_3267 [Paenilisteria newyorkensis]|nr:hypothetical protein X559_3267 [Listeria newyorkensis]